MDPPPPPSYDEVIKGEVPSAPPPPQGYQTDQAPIGGAPPASGQHPPYGTYPTGRQSPYDQTGNSAGRNQGRPHSAYGQTGSYGQQPVPAGARPGGPQYTYIPVQAGYSPATGVGYQYTTGQGNLNPVGAGYQTTPLAYGGSRVSPSVDWNRKVVFILVCFLIGMVVVVVITTLIPSMFI